MEDALKKLWNISWKNQYNTWLLTVYLQTLLALLVGWWVRGAKSWKKEPDTYEIFFLFRENGVKNMELSMVKKPKMKVNIILILIFRNKWSCLVFGIIHPLLFPSEKLPTNQPTEVLHAPLRNLFSINHSHVFVLFLFKNVRYCSINSMIATD